MPGKFANREIGGPGVSRSSSYFDIGMSIGIFMDGFSAGIPAMYAYIHICHLRSSSSGVVPSALMVSTPAVKVGRPNGVGFEIGIAFQLFDVTRILAYALAFVVVILAIEILVVQPIERRASRWRPRTA